MIYHSLRYSGVWLNLNCLTSRIAARNLVQRMRVATSSIPPLEPFANYLAKGTMVVISRLEGKYGCKCITNSSSNGSLGVAIR